MSNFYNMRGGEQTDGLLSMIKDLGDTSEMTMVEIGSYMGDSTTIFAKNFKKVISIDPFINNYDDNEYPIEYAELSLVYDKFIEKISSYNNIFHIKKLSDDAINDITEKVDFVYIDGHHTYEQVKKDITNYRKIIKDNGTIGGHDYSTNGWKDVIKAVNECLGLPDNIYVDCSWIKKM